MDVNPVTADMLRNADHVLATEQIATARGLVSETLRIPPATLQLAYRCATEFSQPGLRVRFDVMFETADTLYVVCDDAYGDTWLLHGPKDCKADDWLVINIRTDKTYEVDFLDVWSCPPKFTVTRELV